MALRFATKLSPCPLPNSTVGPVQGILDLQCAGFGLGCCTARGGHPASPPLARPSSQARLAHPHPTVVRAASRPVAAMVAKAGSSLGYVVYRLGFALRETGQALDRVGSRLQGSYAFREERE